MGLSATLWHQLDSIADWGLLATDVNLTVTGWNRWLEQRSGLTADDAVGRPLLELVPDIKARRLDRYYQQAFLGQTVILSQRLHQYVVPLKSSIPGSGHDWMQQSCQIVPLVGGDGQTVSGTITIIKDVTERVVSEAELLSRARQQTLLATAAGSALAGRDVLDLCTDLSRLLVETLAVDLVEFLELQPDGRSWARLAGVGWTDAAPTIFDPATAARIRSINEGDPARASELLAADPGLQAHGVKGGVVVPVPGRGVKPFGLLGAYSRTPRTFTADEVLFVRSLSQVLGVAAERKRLEAELHLRIEQLADADRRKDEFLALLAHELRNPLAPLRNSLQVVRMANADARLVEKAKNVMDRQLGHMVRLIDDLLDVSRINSNKMNLQRSQVALADVVEMAVESAKPMIDAANHALTVSLPDQPVLLHADPMRLAQVFSNLLTNSAKYTPTGGQIWLTAKLSGPQVAVAVRDSGLGIPPAAQARIFDMFSQVDRTLERETGGLGIGLALVKGLVDMHGGTVTVASEGQGKGSTFEVTLPVVVRDEPGPAPPAAGNRQKQLKGLKILVVDDNYDSAESMAEMLQLLGNDVITAGDGQEAVAKASEYRPELVLMDVGMPRMNGFEATRHIRQQEWGKDMLVFALTGWGDETDKVHSLAAGCDGHLVKPVDLPELQKLYGLKAGAVAQ